MLGKRRRVCPPAAFRAEQPAAQQYLDELNHPGAALNFRAQQPAAQQYLDELNHRVASEHPHARQPAAQQYLDEASELSDCGDVICADSEFEFPTPSRQVRRQRPRRDKAQTPLKLRGQRVSRRASRAASGASASVQAAMSEPCLHRHASDSAPAGSPGPCNCHNTCRP